MCEYCRSARENLCERAVFTGWMVDGGYAAHVVAPEDFVYALPEGFSDLHVVPLLCAGIIGFRSLRLSGVRPGGRLAMYGFGAAAHVAIQVARYWKIGKSPSTPCPATRAIASWRSIWARCGPAVRMTSHPKRSMPP